jgi:DNA-directed RNA polymerase specialized sigma24 family protein
VALRPTAPGDRRSPNDLLAEIDADRIRLAASGDQRAFDQLYDALFPIVWALSLRHAAMSPEDAENLTERLLERIVLSLDGYPRKLAFSTWLRRFLSEEIRAFARRPRRARVSPRRTRVPLQPRT